MSLGAGLAIVLVVLSVVIAARKVPHVALLLAAAGLAWIVPQLFVIFGWYSWLSYSTLFAVLATGLSGYAIVRAAQGGAPPEQEAES